MLTVTYDAANARVSIEVTESPSSPASPSSADVEPVTIERSVDEITWTTVRGALDLELVDGILETALYDYEFVDGVENHYRVRSLEEDESPSSPSSPDDDVLHEDSLTPDLAGQVWLKHPMFAFLNQAVTVTGWGAIARAARVNLAEPAGRSWPVATGDVRGSRAFELQLQTTSAAAEQLLDLTIAAGGTLFLHVPAGSRIPGGYVEITDDTETERRTATGDNRYTTLPLRIAAAPHAAVHGGTITYAGLLSLDPDYEGTEMSAATYADLLELVGQPNDLVVS